MELITQHFTEYWKYYVAGVVVLLPLIILLRRWALPLIQYTIELTIYLGLMHCIIHGILLLACWFKDQSTMKRAFDKMDENFDPGWTTPLTRFWDYTQYAPQWIFFFELVLTGVVIYLMWQYRPLQLQRAKKKPAPPKKKPLAGDYAQRNRMGGHK